LPGENEALFDRPGLGGSDHRCPLFFVNIHSGGRKITERIVHQYAVADPQFQRSIKRFARTASGRR
jgi:hypothetical protein